MIMFKVCLKDGKTAEVSLEELEDYLHQNADKIKVQHFQRRGLRRQKVSLEQQS